MARKLGSRGAGFKAKVALAAFKGDKTLRTARGVRGASNADLDMETAFIGRRERTVRGQHGSTHCSTQTSPCCTPCLAEMSRVTASVGFARIQVAEAIEPFGLGH